ncbi:hypothetical protein KC361_g8941 [Hortaea werneckii]|nr:hypothetical protein KC361_g8941 [Hortaea werneckii]
MSNAGPSNQLITKNAPIGLNEDFVRSFANSMNLSMEQARIQLAEIQKPGQAATAAPPLPPPPPPPAPTQSVDKRDNKTLRHKVDSVEVENKNLRNELNKVRNHSSGNRSPSRNDANTTQLSNKYIAFEKEANDKFANQDKWNAACKPIVEKSKQRLDKIEECLFGDVGMSKVETDVSFLYEFLAVLVNKNLPDCGGLNEAYEYYKSTRKLPPSFANKLKLSSFNMGSMAGALPAPQPNNTPMGQNMMPPPQQQQQQQQQQMVPQQHQKPQQFPHPSMMHQQFPQQQLQLPFGMSPSPMGYGPNHNNMLMPGGQPQQQQQQQQPTYGSAMMPYLGQGGMLPHSYQQ